MVRAMRTGWAAFWRDQAGTAALEYVIIVASVGVVLAAVLTDPDHGIGALYEKIFAAITPGNPR